jgi:hypothetical protein
MHSTQPQGSLASDNIDVNNTEQVRRYANEWGVTEIDIRQAAAIFGSSRSMIKEYLKPDIGF